MLDTHAFIWWMQGCSDLSARASALIADPAHTVLVSAVVVWEIGIKITAGKLTIPEPAVDAIARVGFVSLSIDLAHAQAAGRLPLHHRDPFDRMLIAQAQVEGLPIMTADLQFRQYGVEIIRP